MAFVEMHVKWSVALTDRLNPEILTVLEIKGQLLHRVRLHVKVPGWLLSLHALLTKKLPRFLSRLNEMSSGGENMCLVSGSLRRIVKFLRITFFIPRFCGWQVRVNVILSVSSFCEEHYTPLHSHINHNKPQFFYSLWQSANSRNVSSLSRW